MKVVKNNLPFYVIMGLLGLIAFLYLLLRIMWKKSRGKRVLVPLRDYVSKHDNTVPLTRIISVIGYEYDNPNLTIVDVAAKCNLSEAEIANCLEEEFGLNFMEYHDRVRIENRRNKGLVQ